MIPCSLMPLQSLQNPDRAAFSRRSTPLVGNGVAEAAGNPHFRPLSALRPKHDRTICGRNDDFARQINRRATLVRESEIRIAPLPSEMAFSQLSLLNTRLIVQEICRSVQMCPSMTKLFHTDPLLHGCFVTNDEGLS